MTAVILALFYFLISSRSCAGIPEHMLSYVGSQQSLYIQQSLLNQWAAFRSPNAYVRSFKNILFNPIGPNQWNLFNSGQAVENIADHFDPSEPQLTTFLTDEHLPTNGSYPFIEPLPAYFYQLWIIYNLRDNTNDTYSGNNPPSLSITSQQLADLYAGRPSASTWANIAAPGTAFDPAFNQNTNVTVVAIRGQDSVNEILSQFLFNTDQTWNGGPVPPNGYISNGSDFWFYNTNNYAGSDRNKSRPPYYVLVDSQDAVIGMVMNTIGAIGCVSSINLLASDAATNAGYFQINGIAPGLASLQQVITDDYISFDGTSFTTYAEFINQTQLFNDNTLYPLVGFSYMLIRNNPMPGYTCDIAVELLRYYRWLNRDPIAYEVLSVGDAARDGNIKYYYVQKLPSTAYYKFIEYLSHKLTCADSTHPIGTSVWDVMLATIASEVPINLSFVFGMYLLLPVSSLIASWFLGKILIYWFFLLYKIQKGKYQIRSKNIIFIETSRERYREMLRMRPYLDNHDLKGDFTTGEYGFCVVLLRPIHLPFNSATFEVRKELIQMQDWKTHNNLAKFLGVTEIRQDRFIVSEMTFREYVHLYRMQGIYVSKELVFKSMFKAPKEMHNVFLTPLLWCAPEILKATLNGKGLIPTKASDIYSFAVILYEIITRNMPFKFNSNSGNSPVSLLMRILQRKRPLCPLDLETTEAQNEISSSMQMLMRSCWSSNPETRLKTDEIALIFKAVQAETKRVADLTIVHTDWLIDKQKSEIKNYNSDLKQRVLDLRKASEDFLTPSIYEKVKAKLPIEPTYTERAYILHLTMVDYENLLEETHGESAIALIERFQVLVSQFIMGLADANIFRLHTAGDDCTIIGAIPNGGIEYADRMAVLAMDLLAIMWKAEMLDIDTDRIKIRLGLHCGPVISGLHGTDHTEFTVIGETRDIAEDMERLSATYRILVSEDFVNDVNQFQGFSYIENADRDRAHEKVKTYWLLGRKNYTDQSTLDEIHADYGSILDGKIPERVKDKKVQSTVEFQYVPTERVTSRRASLAVHKAFKKEESSDRPAILESRKSTDRSRVRHPTSANTARVLENLSESLIQFGGEELVTLDVVRLQSNQQLIMIDCSEKEHKSMQNQNPPTNLVHVQFSDENNLMSASTVSRVLPNQSQLNATCNKENPNVSTVSTAEDNANAAVLQFKSKSDIRANTADEPATTLVPKTSSVSSAIQLVPATSYIVEKPKPIEISAKPSDINTETLNTDSAKSDGLNQPVTTTEASNVSFSRLDKLAMDYIKQTQTGGAQVIVLKQIPAEEDYTIPTRPSVEIPSDLRLRRRAKRKPHRPSIRNHVGTDPHDILEKEADTEYSNNTQPNDDSDNGGNAIKRK